MVAEEILTALPEEVVSQISGLVTILKAVGVLTIFYLLWLAVRGIITMKTYRKIDRMYNDVQEIKRKLKIK